jgi:hypothetical protein
VPRNRVFRSGRNRLRIYLSAKEQGVQEWKEQAADLSEPQGTGCSRVEMKRLEWKEHAADLSEYQGTGRAGVEGRGCGST